METVQPGIAVLSAAYKRRELLSLLSVETAHIDSAMHFAETLFQTVQQALAPRIAANATAWYAHCVLINLYNLDVDYNYRQVSDGYWRELLHYSIRDLAQSTSARFCFNNLPDMLNTIRWKRGRQEVLELIEALAFARQCYPHAFAI